jgi:hypothetical protein
MDYQQEKSDKGPSRLSQLEFELFNQEEMSKHEDWGKYKNFSAKTVRDLLQTEQIDVDERNNGRKEKVLNDSEKKGSEAEDEQNNLYPLLREFYRFNKEVIHDIYGTNGAYKALKRDLLRRLGQVKELVYLKRIEDTLSKTVEARIGSITEDVREKMNTAMREQPALRFTKREEFDEREFLEEHFSEKFRDQVIELLGHDSSLDGRSIKSIRNARDISDFEALHINIDEDYVKSYRELVQHELREQLKGIATAEKEGNEEEKLRSVHEKASFLINFVVSHIDALHGAKEFTKATLLRRIQSDEGAELISSLYEQILKSLETGDATESERMIQELSTQLQVMSVMDRREHTRAIFDKYAPEVELSAAEINTLFTSRTLKTGEVTYFVNKDDKTYHELIGRALENIEIAQYDIALHQMLPSDMRKQAVIDGQMSRIRREMAALKNQIQAFREEIYNTDTVVEEKSEWMSFQKKQELKQAFKALRFVYGIKEPKDEDVHGTEGEDGIPRPPEKKTPLTPLLVRLEGAKNDDDVSAILAVAEKDIIAYLGKRGVSEDRIKSFKNIDPYFNLYNFFNEWKKQNPLSPEGKEKEKEEDSVERQVGDGMERNSIISKSEVLEDVRGHLEQMQEIVDRDFSDKHDKDAFDDSRRYLQKLLKDQQFIIEEPVYDGTDSDASPVYDGVEMRMQQRWAQQDLPALERQHLGSLMNARHHQEKYQHLEELRKAKFFDLDINLENPNNIREGLEAMFGGFYEVPKGHNQLQKLSKVMSLEHPLTAIRMHAGKKKPFAPNGTYEMHHVPGRNEPASFLDRAKHVLKRAQEYLLRGNYSQLEALFQQGQVADRLFVDASFFPLKTLKDPQLTQDVLFKQEYKGSQVAMVVNNDRIPNTNDRKYFEREYNRLEGKNGTFKRDQDLAELSSVTNALVDEGAFQMTFGDDEGMQVEAIADYQDSLVYNEDGTINQDASLEAFESIQDLVTSGAGQRLGLGVPGTKLSVEKLKEIAKDYPVMAGRMAQYNSMLAGGTIGGAEMALKLGLNVGRFAKDLPGEVLSDYWKKLDWYSPQHIWMAVDQMIEHISGLSDFRTKIGSYDLLQKVFAGTLVGNEFAKLYQGEEDKRVGEFKDAFGDFGHQDVIDKIYTASDQFELKAALLEGMENRGIITLEDLMDRRFFKQLNLYTKNVTVPMDVSKEAMESDEEVKFKMIEHLRAAMDDIWGDGTWQSWRSASAGKYESKRKEAWDNFSGNSGREKARYYEHYWDLLRTEAGRKELKRMHPGELVGNIEQDLEQGDNDSGTNFAIMQAMISMGIVKLDHVRRLQTAHTNDLPIHTLLEPKQAEMSGLTKHVKEALDRGDKLEAGSPLVDFYQGKKTLPLKGILVKGKWKFPMTEKAKREAEAKEPDDPDRLQDIEVTVHQLQAWREAQPKFHREMDNSCIGIFSPCYEWAQIENAMDPNTQGNIQGRPHDIVAAYRGIHYEFGAYMESMADTSKMKDALTFKRTVWMAYKAICKTQAYASFMTRQQGRDKDYNTNAFDGSPNFESKHKETRANSGTTNFEKLILEGATGPHQRMGQSSEHLDNIESLSPELRRDFKYMAGYHMVKSLGVNSETGMTDRGSYTAYNKDTYDPSGQWKKVMGSFMDHAKRLASQHSWGAEVIGSLNASGMGDMNMDNSDRHKSLSSWIVGEAKL